jgi:hypothetical protein
MKCEKCGHDSEENKQKFSLYFCAVCYTFAPNKPEELDKYIQLPIKKEEIEPYRKYAKFRGDVQKKGMVEKSQKGKHMSRVPFGYRRNSQGDLVPAQNHHEVIEIFEEFLKEDMNLRKLSEKHNLSVNGLKKILRNFAYIGKVKFDGEIHTAPHPPIIQATLFNHVQDKLDKIEKKSKNKKVKK